ncbi:MAG: YbjN domain-containing protein [Oscillospiraceae bacterium]|nr:YbjN domain-containing protein [Oscillospiraceae bacterium]
MATSPERIENAKKNAEVLLAMLDNQKLKYTIQEQSEEKLHVRIHFTGEDIPITLHIIIRADRQIVSVLSAMPFYITEEHRMEAAQAVCAANQGLIDGSFDLNLKTGEVRFRLTSCFIGSVLSEDLFSYLMFVSAETIDRYNDRFCDLNTGTLELQQFLQKDADDEAK